MAIDSTRRSGFSAPPSSRTTGWPCCSSRTRPVARRSGSAPLSLIAHPRFQAWLRAQNARRFSVFVSVNAIRPQRKRARVTRSATSATCSWMPTGTVRRAGGHRRATRPPAAVLRAALVAGSPARAVARDRLHQGERRGAAEAARARAADRQGRDVLCTDHAAARVLQSQVPAAPVVTGGVSARATTVPTVGLSALGEPGPSGGGASVPARPQHQRPDTIERARRYLAAIPPAVAGNHGDAATFRVCCRLVRGFALERRGRVRSADRVESVLCAAVVGGGDSGEAQGGPPVRKGTNRWPLGHLSAKQLAQVPAASTRWTSSPSARWCDAHAPSAACGVRWPIFPCPQPHLPHLSRTHVVTRSHQQQAFPDGSAGQAPRPQSRGRELRAQLTASERQNTVCGTLALRGLEDALETQTRPPSISSEPAPRSCPLVIGSTSLKSMSSMPLPA